MNKSGENDDEREANGVAGGFAGDEETTPAIPRREPSAEATALRNLGLALNSIAQHCGESASIVDELETDERRHSLVGLAIKLGQLGDIAHDARRLVRGLAGLTD
jgi:hypothetical protein